MFLVNMMMWLWEHKGDISLAAVIGYMLKQGIPLLLKKYRLDRDEDRIQWTIEKVEKLTGETYIGPTEKSWKTVRKSSKVLLRLLPAITNQENLLRGVNMDTNKVWILSVVGFVSVEVIEKNWGYKVPPELQGWAADGLQYLFFAIAAWWNRKQIQERQHPFDGGVNIAQPTISDQPRK